MAVVEGFVAALDAAITAAATDTAAALGLTGASAVATAKSLLMAGLMAMTTAFQLAMQFGGSSGQPDILTSSTGLQVNQRDSQAEIGVLYGMLRLGMNQVYVGTADGNNNKLYVIGVICEGEIDSLVYEDGVAQVWLDDKQIDEYIAEETHNYQIYYTDCASSEFFSGTADQNVSTTMQAAIAEWNDPLRHTAYMLFELTWDSDVFQGLPNFTGLFKGRNKIYDPRDESYAWSDNPALCLRDFITLSSQRGGMGISADRIDDDSVGDAATYCEDMGWTCNLLIDNKDTPVIDNVQYILDTFRGVLIYSGNKFKLKYKELSVEAVVMNLTEDDVVDSGDESTLKITQPSIFDTPNAIRVKYINPDDSYQYADYVYSDAAAIASDGDYREDTIQLNGVSSRENAIKLADYHLKRARINKTVTFTGSARCMQLEPHDLVTLTHPIPGWELKKFRVQEAKINMDWTVDLTLIEEYDSLYDTTVTASSHSYYDTNLLDPSATVGSVREVSISEEVYTYRDRSFTRLKVNFSPPLASVYPYWKHALIWLKIGADGEWKFMTNSESDYQLDPVQEGVEYFFRMQSESIFGTKQSFNQAYTVSKLVEGKTTVPTSLASISAIASGDTVTIMGDDVDDSDIAGYETRLGGSWDAGILIGFTKAAMLRLTGVKPGLYTFWMSPKDNSGQYAATKRSASCQVFYPANYEDKNSWSWDFQLGQHGNTEHFTDGGDDYLKCSHDVVTGDNLLTNGDFDEDLTGWTSTGNETSAVDSDGISGNCLQITAADANVGQYQDIAVTAEGIYRLKFHYKNTSGNVAAYRIYDQTNGADIVAVTQLADATSWSDEQTVDFSAPTGCTTVRIYLLAATSGDVVYFDEVECYAKGTAYNLTGTWTSPEYDLGSIKTVRVWGDFVTQYVSSAMTWDAIIPVGKTWDDIGISKRWSVIFAISAGAKLEARLKWGDTPGNLTNYADFFQISAPEFTARYVQVEVTITDPTTDAYLWLKKLNMTAAYWQ